MVIISVKNEQFNVHLTFFVKSCKLKNKKWKYSYLLLYRLIN